VSNNHKTGKPNKEVLTKFVALCFEPWTHHQQITQTNLDKRQQEYEEYIHKNQWLTRHTNNNNKNTLNKGITWQFSIWQKLVIRKLGQISFMIDCSLNQYTMSVSCYYENVICSPLWHRTNRLLQVIWPRDLGNVT